MNGLASLIWVTCSWIAAHFASSGAPETSTRVVIISSGTSIFEANSSNSAICSGVASSGGVHHAFWPTSTIFSFIFSRTDRGIAWMYSFDGAHGSGPFSSCSGCHFGSPARSNARTATSAAPLRPARGGERAPRAWGRRDGVGVPAPAELFGGREDVGLVGPHEPHQAAR